MASTGSESCALLKPMGSVDLFKTLINQVEKKKKKTTTASIVACDKLRTDSFTASGHHSKTETSVIGSMSGLRNKKSSFQSAIA